MIFWAIAYAMVLAAIAALLLAVFRAQRLPHGRTAQNLYTQRLAELQADIRDGAVDAATRGEIEAELGRNALHEEWRPDPISAPQTTPQRVTAAVAVALLIPAIVVPVYLVLGTPDLALGTHKPAGSFDHRSVTEAITQLEQRISQEPNDPEPRLLLGRLYMSANHFDKAVAQLSKVVEMVGEVPAALLQYADALAMLNGGKMAGEPAALVQRALKVEPENLTGLWLAGMAADEAGNSQEALAKLRQAKAVSLREDAPTAELDALIARLEAQTGAAPQPPSPTAPAQVAGARLEIHVDIAASLRAQVPAGARLFVAARALDGRPVPLAVTQLPATQLPLTVILDDANAMVPGMNLSSTDKVRLVARISASGNALPQSGDLEGSVEPVATNASGPVTITIERVVP